MRTRPAIAVVLLGTFLGAASASAAPVHWGPRAGVNISAFTGEFGDLIRPDSRTFPNLGLVYQVDLARNLSFRGEVAYSAKGGGSSSEMTDNAGNPIGTTEEIWRFDYLEIPLLLRTRVPIRTGAVPYLEVGPSFGVTLGGHFESRGSGLPDLDLKGDMKAMDLGLGGGFGIEIPAGPSSISVEARYTRGFSDLWKLDNNLTTVNQAWTFAMSWLH